MISKLILGISVLALSGLNGAELFRADFNGSLQPEKSQTHRQIVWHGQPKMVKNAGFKPGEAALLLERGSYGEIPAGHLNDEQGMITFWFKPQEGPEKGSHTYLSARWQSAGGPKHNTYFVLTQGWWENAGGGHIGGKTLFIYNNWFCPGGVDIGTAQDPGWSFYAIGWKKRPDRRIFSTFYWNGNFCQAIGSPLPKGEKIVSPLYLGSDYATGKERSERFANGYFRNVVIYDRMLTQKELDVQLEKQIVPKKINDLKWRWTQSVANVPPTDRRDANGCLLESRSIFIEKWASIFADPVEREKQLDRVKKSGYNVLNVCVWWGSADYETTAVPQSNNFKKYQKKYPQRKLFREFVQAAHRHGLEVHSAFSVAFSLTVAPEWKKFLTPDGRWMNVYDPAFRRAIVDEIVRHSMEFGVDGIDLDYVRTSGNGLDSKIAKTEYERLYERDYATDRKNTKRMNAYTGRCVGDIIFQTQARLRKYNPNIVIRASAKPQLKELGFVADGRNPAFWLEAGWVDVVGCMDYMTVLSTVFFDRCQKQLSCPEGYVVGLGNYELLRHPNGRRYSRVIPDGTPAQQLMYCQRKYRNGNGVMTYFWNVIDDQHIAELRRGPFREHARPYWIHRKATKSLNDIFPLQ